MAVFAAFSVETRFAFRDEGCGYLAPRLDGGFCFYCGLVGVKVVKSSGNAASWTSDCNTSSIGSTDSISVSGLNKTCSGSSCETAVRFSTLWDAGELCDKVRGSSTAAIEAESEFHAAASVSRRCSSACTCIACAIVRNASNAANFSTMFVSTSAFYAGGPVAGSDGGKTKFIPCWSRTCTLEYLQTSSNRRLTENVGP